MPGEARTSDTPESEAQSSRPLEPQRITDLYLLLIVPLAQQAAAFVTIEEAAAVVAEFERWDTVMPIVDPTAWRETRKTAPDNLALARAFLAFRREVEKLREAGRAKLEAIG